MDKKGKIQSNLFWLIPIVLSALLIGGFYYVQYQSLNDEPEEETVSSAKDKESEVDYLSLNGGNSQLEQLKEIHQSFKDGTVTDGLLVIKDDECSICARLEQPIVRTASKQDYPSVVLNVDAGVFDVGQQLTEYVDPTAILPDNPSEAVSLPIVLRLSYNEETDKLNGEQINGMSEEKEIVKFINN